MSRFLEILAETTKASAFRNACLTIGTYWLTTSIKDVTVQGASIIVLGCVIQAWSNYDKRQARKANESNP